MRQNTVQQSSSGFIRLKVKVSGERLIALPYRVEQILQARAQIRLLW